MPSDAAIAPWSMHLRILSALTTWPRSAEYGISGARSAGVDTGLIYAPNAKINSSHTSMKHISETAPPGTVVSVSRGLYRHVGLLSEVRPGSPRTVLSLNPAFPRQVREEPLHAFARGMPVNIEDLGGILPSSEVLRRARSGLHPTYSWTAFNCEHFVRFAHGLAQESPQLTRLAVLGSLAAVAFIGTRAQA